MASQGSDLVPPGPVSAWLTGRVPGFRRITGIAKTATGQSNPTFILDIETTPGTAPETAPEPTANRLVLRRKPPGTLLKSAHAVEREYRVLRALADTPVPVPRLIGLCEDSDLIGTPFFVMTHVAGRTEIDPRCPGLSNDQRRALYDAMNATLAALHRLDPAAIGLGDYGRPGGYFARQLARWTEQYRATQTDDLPAMEALIDWLGAQTPPEAARATLVHGDWRLDNLLFDPATGAITAVLDWELSTLGDPLADLGAQLMQWAMPTGDAGRGLAGVDRAVLGLPSDADYVESYALRAGLSEAPDMRFPVAFSFFRMAAIVQGVKWRALEGNASNPEKALKMGRYVPIFAQTALDRLSAEA